MQKELQDKVWASLPPAFRREVRSAHRNADNSTHVWLDYLFGSDNLTAKDVPICHDSDCTSTREPAWPELAETDSERLHIAAMAMAGLLANSGLVGYCKNEDFADKALQMADSLIARCKSGKANI